MADVKWIKVTTDVFDDEKILLIESLPDADSIIVIWFKLLCLAGKQNNSGVFIMGNKIPCTDGMLATIFRRKESTVQLALQTFEQFGMIEIIDGVITLPNWGKHQNLEQLEARKKYQRDYQRDYRQKQKLLTTSDDSKCLHKHLRNDDVNTPDKIREEKIRLEEEGEEDKNNKPIRHKYGEYKNVLLSDADLEKLKDEFPQDWQNRIENLSSYIASTGKSYKNHLATIRNWARKESPQQQKRTNNTSANSNPFLELAKDENLF
jgi:predicted phage replisome organizer